MTDRVAYDEFSMFHENAAEYGIPYDGSPTVRREQVEVAPGRLRSALWWGVTAPESADVTPSSASSAASRAT